jgi:hypothetical protein
MLLLNMVLHVTLVFYMDSFTFYVISDQLIRNLVVLYDQIG